MSYPPQGTGGALVALNPALNAYPKGRHAGNLGGLSAVDVDLVPANIKWTKTIFGVVGTAVAWVFDLFAETGTPPIHMVPVPTLAMSQTNLNAGDGGQVTSKTLNPPVPVVAPTVENSMLLIDDCEALTWNEYVAPDVTSTLDNVVFKIGAGSAKLDVALPANVGRLATGAHAAMDLTTYNYIRMWVRSSIAINVGDLHFLLDEHAQCVSPLKTLDIGALVAGTWTQVSLPLGVAAGLGAIISYGAYMTVDKGAFILNVDQVRATKGA